jgi:hypothetical protein
VDEDKYFIPLLPQTLEAIETDSRYPWAGGYAGHLQTIVDYLETESVAVEGICRMCKPKKPIVKPKDRPKPDSDDEVLMGETGRPDNKIARGIRDETLVMTAKVLAFEVYGIEDAGSFFYPEMLKTRGGSYRLVARIESSHRTGLHFKARVYHDNPVPGVYAYDDLVNGGYAMRMNTPTGFVGRNELSMLSFYARISDNED